MTTEAHEVVPLSKVRIRDKFWCKYSELVRNTVIPYQWEALNDRIPDAAPSHAMRNFKIAAGIEEGEFGGMVFQDSDVAKWLEAVGYSLATHPNPDLERIADEAIDIIVQAQMADGYLNTYYTIKEPGKRWTNLLDCHELYCAGHMIEAAVAYYRGTGKRKLLDAMCRFADHIDSVFGPEDGKIHGYCGHQEIELALVKLYQVTGEKRYLRLSEYFINERGKSPNFFIQEWEARGRTSHWFPGQSPRPNLEYNQSHLPVREQSVAVGHAVRAVYMYTAMADLARETGDPELLAACDRLWENVTKKQMYITGGIGSTHHGEAFTFDYDLPNDTVYAETCASIGLVFFAHRMLQIRPNGEYADVIERVLYNLIGGSMAQDGKHYFYVNPLEVWPKASEKNPGKHHVKAERQKWFGCACCPPNVARLITSLGQYIYSSTDDTLFAHLYIGSEVNLTLGETDVEIRQTSQFPWSGNVHFTISPAVPKSFKLALRIPAWSRGAVQVRVNGDLHTYPVQSGYMYIERVWSSGDKVDLVFPFEPQLIQANPQIRADAGKVAISRGPLVYCVEEIDNGTPISSLTLDSRSPLRERFDETLFDGIVVVEAAGYQDADTGWENGPYRPFQNEKVPKTIKAIPYFLWGNRGLGEMSVWIRVTA
ncbi:MAG: glycoside hydrolase family 127 protein [Alicyclobacillus sp.]|nr:glycoside hydrolase family 127 protein [Alicyclobacillus sp.]